jgi:hypothetical protein
MGILQIMEREHQMEFKVVDMKRNTETGMVFEAHWTLSKQDGEFSSSLYGSIGLEPSDSFIDFNNLTEETVKTWLAEKLDLVEMEANLDAQLADQKAPKVASGLPW